MDLQDGVDGYGGVGSKTIGPSRVEFQGKGRGPDRGPVADLQGIYSDTAKTTLSFLKRSGVSRSMVAVCLSGLMVSLYCLSLR